MNKNLETFLERVRAYEDKKIKVAQKEIEGFGEIVFARPKQEELLEFLKKLAEQTKHIKGNEEPEIELDLSLVANAASKLVYNSCSELQAKEVREMYKGIDYEKIPLELFGLDVVMELGNFISEVFGAVKVKEEVEADIKN